MSISADTAAGNRVSPYWDKPDDRCGDCGTGIPWTAGILTGYCDPCTELRNPFPSRAARQLRAAAQDDDADPKTLRVLAELASDPGRSNRAIAKVAGCGKDLVAKIRGQL